MTLQHICTYIRIRTFTRLAITLLAILQVVTTSAEQTVKEELTILVAERTGLRINEFLLVRNDISDEEQTLIDFTNRVCVLVRSHSETNSTSEDVPLIYAFEFSFSANVGTISTKHGIMAFELSEYPVFAALLRRYLSYLNFGIYISDVISMISGSEFPREATYMLASYSYTRAFEFRPHVVWSDINNVGAYIEDSRQKTYYSADNFRNFIVLDALYDELVSFSSQFTPTDYMTCIGGSQFTDYTKWLLKGTAQHNPPDGRVEAPRR